MRKESLICDECKKEVDTASWHSSNKPLEFPFFSKYGYMELCNDCLNKIKITFKRK